MSELKSCPFCGAKARLLTKTIPTEKDNPIIHDFRYEYIIKCNKCKASIGFYKSQTTAKKAYFTPCAC